jgi:mannose-6-phosphate isomerase-like protein (cupin superfamily)
MVILLQMELLNCILNRTMKKLALLFLLSTSALNLLAQNSNRLSSNIGYATIVHANEVNSAAKAGHHLPVADSVLRVVSIEGKYNVGVSVVTRSKINGVTPPDAIVHDVVTEVYNIVKGNGVLLVGGTLDSAERLPAKSPIVLKITGPSARGKRITGGTLFEVGPGDIIIIPPNTPHGFIELKTNSIVYTLTRIDTEKVLELKN